MTKLSVKEKNIIKKVSEIVKSKMYGEGSGHDWWHIERVWKMAKKIGKKENVNLLIVELGALLHDIADFKFSGGNLEENPKAAREILKSFNLDDTTISHVAEITRNVSFKGESEKNLIKTVEGKVVQDADRIDALGAIGIARCFAYGGSKNREIYNPETLPQKNLDFKKYKNIQSPSINHFYEKVLLLKDLMNTKTGRKIAERRHKFIEKFLERFFAEWNGKK